MIGIIPFILTTTIGETASGGICETILSYIKCSEYRSSSLLNWDKGTDLTNKKLKWEGIIDQEKTLASHNSTKNIKTFHLISGKRMYMLFDKTQSKQIQSYYRLIRNIFTHPPIATVRKTVYDLDTHSKANSNPVIHAYIWM